MSIIDWALQHHHQWRRNHTTDDVTVITADGSFRLKATKIDPGSVVNPNGVRTPSQTVLFMFTKAEVTFAIRKGIRIVDKDGTYEVVITGNTKEYYDDPNQITVNVHAKHIGASNAIS